MQFYIAKSYKNKYEQQKMELWDKVERDGLFAPVDRLFTPQF